MRQKSIFIPTILILLLELISAQSNESNSVDEQNNKKKDILLKRSLDKTALRDLLATRSLSNFDSDLKSLSDLVKRQDVSDTFLKNLLKLSPTISKSSIHQDLNSILSIDSDFEDEEILKKSQALGLSIKQSLTTITSNSTTTTRATTTAITTATTTKATTTTTRVTTTSTTTTTSSPIHEDDLEKSNDEDDDDYEAEKPKPAKRKISKKTASDHQTEKLSSKQLKQIYKFLRKKEKKSKKKDSVENLIGSLLSSPNYEVHLKLRDSLAAKAANDALLKWHSKAPFASLNQLEEMYHKFYEFYYEYFDIHSGHDLDHHFDHGYDHHHFGHHFGHHHHHHPHHDHHHLNLLDFLASKSQSSESDPKNSLFEKIVGSDYLTRQSSWNDYHHSHYDDDPEHVFDHYHSHHDHHHLYDPFQDNIYMHHDTDQFDHHIHDYHTHFNNPNPHHHYHYSQHPIYDDYGRRLIYTTGQLERFPASNNEPVQSRPGKINKFIFTINLGQSLKDCYEFFVSLVVCTNYPEHSTEGFKSFISVESCNQPSFLGSNGVPLFGNGCVFKYMCELGYQPLGGITSAIKCNNGFWTARAVCIKQGIGSNQSNSNLLKRSDPDQNLTESKRVRRSDEQIDYDDQENVTLQTDYDTTTVPIEITSPDRSLLLDKLLEKLKTTTSTKSMSTSTSSIPIIDPQIDWSNIIDSDSEKTIYESFYELLENGPNKIGQNLDIFDLGRF
ncbi:hypothetical protein BpHYR1_003129 [Brachionus plicatilis]|uniref:Sushi domain-containing protein n=1 Tax=Brachionus plicatilis TaxID=10195 RepID=A0A3M7QA34_BRAPC|nr:hypothetical protein BpHYR1_003129 [Brachionus plicatilis]